MERRRTQAILKTDTQLDTSITAGSILNKKILRFGNQHQIREATWLISEMMKHQKSKNSQPLFLQDREGRLDSELTLNAVLKTLLQNVDESEVDDLTDEILASKMRQQFHHRINDIARRDLPEINEYTSLASTIWLSREHKLKTLPVSDPDGRLAGLISPTDMLKGLGQALDFNPEKELPKPDV